LALGGGHETLRPVTISLYIYVLYREQEVPLPENTGGNMSARQVPVARAAEPVWKYESTRMSDYKQHQDIESHKKRIGFAIEVSKSDVLYIYIYDMI